MSVNELEEAFHDQDFLKLVELIELICNGHYPKSNLDFITPWHGSMLSWAVFSGSFQVSPLINLDFFARLLLESGANVHVRDNNGDTPLHIASVSTIWNDKRRRMIKLLIKFGANVDAVNDVGRTPMMVAASWNAASVVEELLLLGADDKMTDNLDKTARDHGKHISSVFDNHEKRIRIVRPNVVETCGQVLPVELAELCGDYIFLPPVRRAIEERANKI